MPSVTVVPPWPEVPALSPPGRVAVVGAGVFGRFCIDAYQKSADVSVLAVADPEPQTLGQVAAPGARLERDWHAVVADEEIEVVHLATPPYLRSEAVFGALAAHKGVFCEKPLALTLAEADAMIEAGRRAGAPLSIDYVMRHHPAYHLLETLASSGLFGAARSISLENYAAAVPPGHWFWDRKKSGGILVEHGVHFFDAYARLAGRPRRLWSGSPRPDAVAVLVEYESDVVGRYYHEFAFPRPVERTIGRTFFERGYVELEGWIPTQLRAAVLAPGKEVEEIARPLGLVVAGDGDGVLRLEATFGDRQRAYQAAIVSGMRDVVYRYRVPDHIMTVSPEDARNSLAVALEAEAAAQEVSPRKVSSAPAPAVASS